MTESERFAILLTVYEKERINPAYATHKQAARVAKIFQNILAFMRLHQEAE